MRIAAIAALLLALLAQRALAQESFTVAPKPVADEKAVFATVESGGIRRRSDGRGLPHHPRQ